MSTSRKDKTIEIKPMSQMRVTLRLVSISPMIQHKWSEKALRQMREKHAGKKTKDREVRDCEQEFRDAAYVTEDGQFGIPAMALKKAVITAAHVDIGVARTLLRKSMFFVCTDANGVLPIVTEDPVMREDVVRVGAGSADLRYRPEFKHWTCDVTVALDAQTITPEVLINLFERAGFGVGVGEMRPEKDGEYGRFMVDREFGFQTEE